MKKLKSVLNMILKILFIDGFDYSLRPEHKEESTDKKESEDLLPMPLLEGDEEVTEGRGSKFLTPKKLITTLPTLLAQIKTGNNSYKLKMKSEKCFLFCITIIKSLKKFTKM